MPNPIVIIHGWSDESKNFRDLARILQQDLGRPVATVRYGDYISMDDEVTFDDLVAAMTRAWKASGLPTGPRSVDAVVHSTGGLVIRDWIATTYRPEAVPIHRLLMLAPANFGSPLAHKGHSMIGRVVKGWKSEKAFQTGERILKGLELASPYAWQLAERDRFSRAVYYGTGRVLCTVLVGNTGYRGISSAANEVGSDGTVRVASANMNCAKLVADFQEDPPAPPVYKLQGSNGQTAFSVMQGENHATIAAKQDGPANPLTRQYYRAALEVRDDGFEAHCAALDRQTLDCLRAAEGDDYTHGFQNTVTHVVDNFGKDVENYFLEFYSPDDDEDAFSEAFYSQVLRTTHPYGDQPAYRSLLVDCTRLEQHMAAHGEHRMTISLTAEPEFSKNGHVGYRTLGDKQIGGIEFTPARRKAVFSLNRTLLAEIILKRVQAPDVFRMS